MPAMWLVSMLSFIAMALTMGEFQRAEFVQCLYKPFKYSRIEVRSLLWCTYSTVLAVELTIMSLD